MTVEQRLLDKWGNIIEAQIIEPGKSLATKITAVDSEHPHREQDFEVSALCSKDDCYGTIVIENSHDKIDIVNFNGSKKPSEFIKKDGEYLIIEWEHKPSSQI